MINVRIGNNIHCIWKIYNNNGSKYSLPGKIQSLYLSSAALEKSITSYEVQNANELTFTLETDDLLRYGVYKLVLRIRESESETEDATYDLVQIFQIVSKTYQDAMKALTGYVELNFENVLNNGNEGLSAYDIAVNNGFHGTEAEWLLSLKGDKGDPGDVDVSLVNNLVDGGTDRALTAEMGKSIGTSLSGAVYLGSIVETL